MPGRGWTLSFHELFHVQKQQSGLLYMWSQPSRREKSQNTNVYVASACIIFLGVPLDKVNYLTKLRVSIGKNYNKKMNIRRHDLLGCTDVAINQSALCPPWFSYLLCEKYTHIFLRAKVSSNNSIRFKVHHLMICIWSLCQGSSLGIAIQK